MRAVPDITMVKGGVGGNAWILEEERAVTLIDSGTRASYRRILECLRALGREPESVSTILLTHGHPDHYGGASRLQRETGARVLIHSADVTVNRSGTPLVRYHWVPGIVAPNVDGFLEDGQVLPVMGGLTVLHTPGHTPGSVAFHLVARDLLFTGDTLLANGRHFRRPLPLPHTKRSDYRRSVQRLSGLSFETAYPGHGLPIVGGAGARLREFDLLRYGRDVPWWWRAMRGVPLVSRLGIGIAARTLTPLGRTGESGS